MRGQSKQQERQREPRTENAAPAFVRVGPHENYHSTLEGNQQKRTGWNIPLGLIERVAGVIEELRTNHHDVCQPRVL